METRKYGYETELTVQMPWSIFVGGRAICSDGHVRRLSRISSTADTFFSIPAAVQVSGKTVAGYVTIETAEGWTTDTPEDPAVVKFVAYSGRKNSDLLPGLGWKRAEVPA